MGKHGRLTGRFSRSSLAAIFCSTFFPASLLPPRHEHRNVVSTIYNAGHENTSSSKSSENHFFVLGIHFRHNTYGKIPFTALTAVRRRQSDNASTRHFQPM